MYYSYDADQTMAHAADEAYYTEVQRDDFLAQEEIRAEVFNAQRMDHPDDRCMADIEAEEAAIWF